MRCTKLTVMNASFTDIVVKASSEFGNCMMSLPLSRDEFLQSLARWDAGMLIQNAFPMLNTKQHCFLITGMLPIAQEQTVA